MPRVATRPFQGRNLLLVPTGGVAPGYYISRLRREEFEYHLHEQEDLRPNLRVCLCDPPAHAGGIDLITSKSSTLHISLAL
jgi:hypothetical protein